MWIGDRIGNALPFPLRTDEAGLLQQSELMRNRGTRHSEYLRQLADAQSMPTQSAQDADTRSIAAELEEFRRDLDFLFFGRISFA